MLNSFTKDGIGSVQNAKAMLDGHHRFLQHNTGITYDAQVQHYVQNPEGVLANNRHFLGSTQEEGQPNGDGTTEGQALHILGYCYAYLATKEQKYLDAAKHHWEAYRFAFYANQPIPPSPQRWICNWICNAKEPVVANWPISKRYPTHGGYKCVPVRFTNGEAQIPHGSPFWGEYLDVVAFAHRGHMAWGAINAGLREIRNPIDWEQVWNHRVTTMPEDPSLVNAWVDWDAYLGPENYSVDWDKEIFPIKKEWVNVWTRSKVQVQFGPNGEEWDGKVVEENLPLADVGKIKMREPINGVYFVNYAVRLPIDKGGYLLKRNEVWHNRPVNTPLIGSYNQMGNAADGEEWFFDATYLLWILTNDPMYRRALGSVAFTVHEYTEIDSKDKFFRQSQIATTPFTDGISYSYSFPSGIEIRYNRDNRGYITVDVDQESQNTTEQQAIWYRVDQQAKIRNTYGGTALNGSKISAKMEVQISPDKDPLNITTWGAPLPDSTHPTNVVVRDVDLGKLIRIYKEDGSPYLPADLRAVAEYGGALIHETLQDNVLDARSANVVTTVFPNNDAGLIIGNWLLPTKKAPVKSITYKSIGNFNMRIIDDLKYRWWWLLPDTGGQWKTIQLPKSDLHYAGYQPDHPNDPRPPGGAVFTELEELEILLDDVNDTNKTFEYAYLNDVPPLYTKQDGYVMLYRLTMSTKGSGMRGLIGDCYILNSRDDNLAYCPGVIPFSNIYEEGSEQIGAWHGMPYPGYQYPLIYTLEHSKFQRHLNNMVDFMYDAQQYYAKTIGVMGPVASAYIWNRWDNLKYGPKDTFTMYHWGDGGAWDGYQPRAFQGGCRAWEELVYRKLPVPPKLVTYCENWIKWLIEFMDIAGWAPTQFPTKSKPVPHYDDFVGHMSGLWLAGTIQAYFAGCRLPGIERCIEKLFKEICDNYIVTHIPEFPMNGSWSRDPRVQNDNGMYYGFWTGELMRGIGMYIMYHTRDVTEPIYPIKEF